MSTETLAVLISFGFGIFAIIGSMIGMLLWIRGEANSDRRSSQATIDAIKDEMKDFHQRLFEMEKDFKTFMKCEEEKRTQILMGK